MKKAYLAGPWFTEKADMLENYAYCIYKLCKSKYDLFRPRAESCNNPSKTYNGNIEAIQDCDIFIALISEKDVGTAFEIGYAKALNKPIILVGYDEKDFERKTNLMLAFAGHICITIDKLYKVFEDTITCKDSVKLNYTWENIE